MSDIEREYIKNVDDTILAATGKTLKKLQQLDMETQLKTNSFYDAYVDYHKEPQKQNITSAHRFHKNKST